MTINTYYSPFFPDIETPGAKGSTIAVVPTSIVDVIQENISNIQEELDGMAEGGFGDNTPPDQVTGLVLTSTATANGDGTFLIALVATWNKSSATDLAGYDLQIKENSGGYVLFATGADNSTGSTQSYQWSVRPNQTFTVQVRAKDRAGNRGAWSASVSALSARDTVPPAAPTGLTVEATFKSFFLNWVNPVDSDLDSIDVYEGASNVQSSSTRIATVGATPGAPSNYIRQNVPSSGTTRYFWIRARDTSGNVSGFLGPVSATTAGNVVAADFVSGLRPIESLSSLPTAGTPGRIVFNTSDNKLYRDTGSVWLATIPATDLTGTIVNGQISSGAIDATKFATGVRPVEILDALPAPGIVGRQVFLTTDKKLYRDTGSSWTTAVPASDLTGTITASQISDNAITTTKFANGLTPVEILGSLPLSGNFTGRTVVLTTDGKLYRYNGSAFVASVPTSDLTGTITAAQIAANTITAAQIAANTITAAQIAAGAITATQIATGTLTADKLAVGVKGQNLVLNPTGANGTTAGWVTNETNTPIPTPFFVSDYTNVGRKSFALIKNSTSEYMSIDSLNIPVTPGKTYVFRFNAYGSSSTANGLYARIWYAENPGIGYVRGAPGVLTYDPISNGPIFASDTKYEFTWAAPANIAWISLSFYNYYSGPNALKIADVEFFEQTTGTVIANGAITTAKISVGAVTANQIAANTITAAQIASDTITAGQIAAGAITASEIAAGAVTAGKIAAGSITAYEIAAGTITANEIAAGTITASRIAVGAITAEKLAIGTPGRNLIANGSSADGTTSGWAVVEAGEGTLSSIDFYSAGRKGFAINKSGSTSAAFGTKAIPVVPGKTYVWSMLIGVPSGTVIDGIYLRLNYGANLGTLQYVNSANRTGVTDFINNGGLPGSPEYRSYIWTCPTGVFWVSPAVYFYNTSGATQLVFTEMQFYEQTDTTSIQDGAITTNKIIVNSLNGDRIQVGTLNADRITAGSVIAGSVTVSSNGQTIAGLGTTATWSGVSGTGRPQDNATVGAPAGTYVGNTEAQTVTNWANLGQQDPGIRINTGSTQIDPGRILISGATTLANWRSGTDSTKIEGGNIQANSIDANKIRIGARGVTTQDLVFQYRTSPIRCTWTDGAIFYTDDDGSQTLSAISAGSCPTPPSSNYYYIYWTKGSTNLTYSTDWSVANGPDNVHMATFNGGPNINQLYGGTIIDGSQITTGTVTADKIIVSSLSALTANIGLLRTSTTGARTEIESNQIRVYDTAGTMRVRMGVW